MNPKTTKPPKSSPREEHGSLRILVVTVAAGGIGGMQRHTHDLVQGLITAGHEVEVICPRAEGLATDMYGAHWTLLDTVGRSREWPGLVVEAYEAASARAPFDVVQSESTSALPLVQARVRTPIVVTYHGNYLGLAKAHIRRARERPVSAPREARGLVWSTRLHFRHGNAWGFRRCESIVVSRQQLRDTARSHFIPAHLLHVVPIGIDVTLFAPRDRTRARRELGLPNGPLLVAVGRLIREKGFDIAIEALKLLRRDYPMLRLIVVGDGPEKERLGALAREIGAPNEILLVGGQPPHEVARYLAAADVFLFPTRRDEAIGIVLLEAMAAGLPVIASSLGGVTEVLEAYDGAAPGILVRPDNANQLATAARRVLSDGSLSAQLSRAARARAVSTYSVETMVERTVAVYRAAIRRGLSSHVA